MVGLRVRLFRGIAIAALADGVFWSTGAAADAAAAYKAKCAACHGTRFGPQRRWEPHPQAVCSII